MNHVINSSVIGMQDYRLVLKSNEQKFVNETVSKSAIHFRVSRVANVTEKLGVKSVSWPTSSLYALYDHGEMIIPDKFAYNNAPRYITNATFRHPAAWLTLPV